MTSKTALLALFALTMSAPMASAQTYGRPYRHADPAPYFGANADGEIIARAAERAQHEPGVTSEFAPDSHQTATGGPVGGVPGYNGR